MLKKNIDSSTKAILSTTIISLFLGGKVVDLKADINSAIADNLQNNTKNNSINIHTNYKQNYLQKLSQKLKQHGKKLDLSKTSLQSESTGSFSSISLPQPTLQELRGEKKPKAFEWEQGKSFPDPNNDLRSIEATSGIKIQPLLEIPDYLNGTEGIMKLYINYNGQWIKFPDIKGEIQNNVLKFSNIGQDLDLTGMEGQTFEVWYGIIVGTKLYMYNYKVKIVKKGEINNDNQDINDNSTNQEDNTTTINDNNNNTDNTTINTDNNSNTITEDNIDWNDPMSIINYVNKDTGYWGDIVPYTIDNSLDKNSDHRYELDLDKIESWLAPYLRKDKETIREDNYILYFLELKEGEELYLPIGKALKVAPGVMLAQVNAFPRGEALGCISNYSYTSYLGYAYMIPLTWGTVGTGDIQFIDLKTGRGTLKIGFNIQLVENKDENIEETRPIMKRDSDKALDHGYGNGLLNNYGRLLLKCGTNVDIDIFDFLSIKNGYNDIEFYNLPKGLYYDKEEHKIKGAVPEHRFGQENRPGYVFVKITNDNGTFGYRLPYEMVTGKTPYFSAKEKNMPTVYELSVGDKLSVNAKDYLVNYEKYGSYISHYYIGIDRYENGKLISYNVSEYYTRNEENKSYFEKEPSQRKDYIDTDFISTSHINFKFKKPGTYYIEMGTNLNVGSRYTLKVIVK